MLTILASSFNAREELEGLVRPEMTPPLTALRPGTRCPGVTVSHCPECEVLGNDQDSPEQRQAAQILRCGL